MWPRPPRMPTRGRVRPSTAAGATSPPASSGRPACSRAGPGPRRSQPRWFGKTNPRVELDSPRAASPGGGISRRFLRLSASNHSQSSLVEPISTAEPHALPRVDGEIIASFPDLRPGSRSARAERVAVRPWRSPRLLAVSAALLLTVFFAVSELATLRGAKAHDASAYLTRELGSPLSSASLVRAPARGVKVTFGRRGFRTVHGQHALRLELSGMGTSSLAKFTHGVSVRTTFGRVVMSATPRKTEQYLVVDGHHGTKTWRGRRDAKGLRPRIGDDGYVAFIAGHRGTGDFVIAPPKVLGADGRDISPDNLHWSLARARGSWWLELALDDSELPTPYIIDPASFNVGTGTVGPTAAGASLQLSVPAAVKVNAVMTAPVRWLGGSNVTVTPPAGGSWTQLDSTRNHGTTLGAPISDRVPTSAC